MSRIVVSRSNWFARQNWWESLVLAIEARPDFAVTASRFLLGGNPIRENVPHVGGVLEQDTAERG